VGKKADIICKMQVFQFEISQLQPLHFPSVVFCITSSIITRNSGDSIHPCLTPEITGMGNIMLYNLCNNKLIKVHGAAERTMHLNVLIKYFSLRVFQCTLGYVILKTDWKCLVKTSKL
jgi:hypothetical protein